VPYALHSRSLQGRTRHGYSAPSISLPGRWYRNDPCRNAPGNTSSGIVDKLNQEIKADAADAKINATFTDIGGIAIAGSPADFSKLIAEEIEKWGKVIRAANIKPE
jgi:tripartite-type tricarboxylate transporter receptor subunit TctC